jgi:hypothetical protein
MPKKLTITVEGEPYEGLHRVIGARRISRSPNDLRRPHVTARDLDDSYRAMAADEEYEREAAEWAENLDGDEADDPGKTPRRGERCRPACGGGLIPVVLRSAG